MIGRWIDRIVSWLSPASAARRVHARQTFESIHRRDYDAAKKNRTNSNWLPANRSPDLELQSDAATTRARARDLVRNNAYARAVVNALVRNVVGTGIRPQARIEGADDLNQAADELFSRWARKADITGHLSFFEIQRLAYRETIEAGECLLHYTSIDEDRGRALPFALELIDADRLADDAQTGLRLGTMTENEIRRGVEVDALGRVVAYWIYDRHPNDLSTIWSAPVRRPADEFIHLFKVDRIGQTRISWFAPILPWLKNLTYYLDNELQASAVASCFTAAIKTMAGPADSGILNAADSSSSDTDGNTLEYLQPGMIARLMPGEEIETINPGRPNSQAEPWILLLLRSLAVGGGLSYERMARDYTKTNYSSARSSDLEDRKEFRADQQWMIGHLCEPIWQKVIESGVREGKLPGLSAFDLVTQYDTYTQHVQRAPGWEWVDPTKEVQASETALENNLTTLSEELGARGRDLMETLEQRAKEKALLEKLDLAPTAPEIPTVEPKDGEETEIPASAEE